jgi:hypothetical protein
MSGDAMEVVADSTRTPSSVSWFAEEVREDETKSAHPSLQLIGRYSHQLCEDLCLPWILCTGITSTLSGYAGVDSLYQTVTAVTQSAAYPILVTSAEQSKITVHFDEPNWLDDLDEDLRELQLADEIAALRSIRTRIEQADVSSASPEVMELARRAIQAVDQRRGEDVEGWAKRLAEDVGDAVD